tara:strand:- start:1495 stop:1905 length:411 start_codon:yes stop_codon:yes gene_type:complete
MKELQDEGAFPTFRDVLLLAGAVGFRQGRRAAFTLTAGDPIRYETLSARTFSDTLINMIAVNTVDDPEVMDESRLEERVRIFEEFANGGLEYIQEQTNVRHQPAALVVRDLVIEALDNEKGAEAVSVDELLDGLKW